MVNNDLVGLAAERAALAFGADYGMFDAACFSAELIRFSQLNTQINYRLVRVILTGREDIEVIDDSHYRLKR